MTKTDPIVATDEIGWYVVPSTQTMSPAWSAPTPVVHRPKALLLPEEHETDAAIVEAIFEQVSTASRELGVSVVGGHTEITHGIDRPDAVGAMFGEVTPDALVRSDGAQAGDTLILTKGGIAVEGTAILPVVGAATCGRLHPALVDQAARLSTTPATGVVRDALEDCHPGAGPGSTRCRHPPREASPQESRRRRQPTAWEPSSSRALPIFPETRALCDTLGLDPLGIIASGSCAACSVPQQCRILLSRSTGKESIAAAVGAVCREPGCSCAPHPGASPMRQFARDEISAALRTRHSDGYRPDAPQAPPIPTSRFRRTVPTDRAPSCTGP